MIEYAADVVVSLGMGKGTMYVETIRDNGILVGTVDGRQGKRYFDLETGLLRERDPDADPTQPVYCRPAPQQGGMATPTLEQFVAAVANPQVKADHLYQGLKASSVILPPDVKFVRNYLGGVLVIQGTRRLSMWAVINFIMKGFDKE